jgi:hypothetical protein
MNGTIFSARAFFLTISKKIIGGRNIFFILVWIVGKMEKNRSKINPQRPNFYHRLP